MKFDRPRTATYARLLLGQLIQDHVYHQWPHIVGELSAAIDAASGEYLNSQEIEALLDHERAALIAAIAVYGTDAPAF